MAAGLGELDQLEATWVRIPEDPDSNFASVRLHSGDKVQPSPPTIAVLSPFKVLKVQFATFPTSPTQ